MATNKGRLLLATGIALIFATSLANGQTCTQGDIRLVGGASEMQGRVEVCNNGAWGTVCDDAFGDSDAQVACRQLGYLSGGATAQCCAAYGQGTGSILLDQVGCTGTEASLFNCPANPIGSHDCSHGEDVGITCASVAVCTQGDVRLVGGASEMEGRVEVCNNGAWGTVCDDGWSTVDASVVCAQLGFSPASSAPCCAAYGQGTGPITLDNVACTGTETSLLDCSHNGLNIHNCAHSEDAGVVCGAVVTLAPCTQGEIRLIGGSSDFQGRVEVCNNGAWGTVCDDSFGTNDAQVACRQLGFNTEGATAECCATYGQGTGNILLDDVACAGTEASLFDCGNAGIGTHNCAHGEDVGITCSSLTCVEQDVRLVGGSTQLEGRVEVCNGGAWGTVCDDFWGTTDGNVVCAQLGFGTASDAPCCANFGQGTGAIVLDDVGCTGTETNLFDCPNIGINVHNCAHSEDAGVVCTGTSTTCSDGEIRLVGGSNSLQGRVEVCNNGAWGTVCDDSFGNSDAQVACRQLGYSSTGATAQCCAAYGQGTGSIVLDDLACTGTETSLFSCSHGGLNSHNCAHSEDVGVICASATCDHGLARLVNGANAMEGRVEVCNNGTWGTVCDDLWDLNDASVACAQLGYGPATSAPSFAAFGQGTGSIVLDNLGCVGTEASLFDCPSNGIGNHNCAHSEDASAICGDVPPECTDGDIQLVGGADMSMGRVEVCSGGMWGTVCDDSFADIDAQVACRQLGYSGEGATAQCCAAYGQGTGTIVLDDLACAGTETSLFSCTHTTSHNCAHSEDVGITCQVGCTQGSIRLANGPSDMEGRVEVCNSGSWGTVCDDSFGAPDANVACRQLGFSNTGATFSCCAAYGQGTGDIILDDLVCTGTETSLFECGNAGIGTHNCAHSEDIGILCEALVGECINGDIRLVGGTTMYEGRVEVCNNNAWGTVCDDLWDTTDGSVVCAQLGYGTATSAPQRAAFGQGTGSIVLDNVACTGTETNLFDCPNNGIGIHNCAHSEDAGVVCSGPAPDCTDGDVRLVGGGTIFEGRVEVCNNGAWGTVCDDLWDTTDGNVVCTQLGFGTASSAPCCAAYGQGTGDILLDNVQCSGSESRLLDCTHNGLAIHNCAHSEDAGVVCSVCTNGDVRLVGGSTDYEGRVEVCDQNAWGTVCDDLWDTTDGNVVCAQLGFGMATAAQCCANFGQGTGSILLDNVGCIGTEMSILDCPSNGVGIHNCAHSEDAGVTCQVCSSGSIRLVGGTDPMQGRVELCFNNAWGTVCDDLWDINDGNVACRQLGYGMATQALSNAFFGQGTGPIVLDDLQCVGTEVSLFNCAHSGVNINNCVHAEDAGVICEDVCTDGALRLQDGEYNSGRVEVCNGGVWGTVCDDSWDLTDATVACRQLDFPAATSSQCCATYGQGTGSILLDNLLCTGSETRLIDCPHNGLNIHNCAHSEDAGLLCAHNVRLVGGTTMYEGRVEVYANGGWGTVCDDFWGIVDANVVCNQLGYGIATSASGQAFFGQGVGNITLDNLQCTGNETSLFDCPHNGVNIHNCAHSEDAGAVCTTPIQCTQGDVRLVGGTSDLEGRVEVCNNGEWGTVCDDSWGVEDAAVVCRQLGYASASSAPCCAQYGQGLGDIVLDDLQCVGTESSIFDCPHNGINSHNCAHTEDAGAVCILCVQGDVRLVGGATEFEGRVEVCVDNAWGTVCDDSWDITDGNIVCRQLSYGIATRAPRLAFFGQGTGNIVLDDLQCMGTESRLIDCPNSGINVHNCVHAEDASVTCASVCPQGDVRLVGGTDEFEGRVEICNDNQWGTVCDDLWDSNDAMVVCRQLGYTEGTALSQAFFGQGLDPIWLDNVQCVGNELYLINCTNDGIGLHNCGHTEDAGVRCGGATTPPPVCSQGDIRLVGGADERQGRVEVCNSNTWGTVCDDAFGAEDARVVCMQLGFNGDGATAQCCSAYGQGTGQILLDNVGCLGTEVSLFDCPNNGIGVHNCVHFEDVGVSCPRLCNDGDLRLVNGANVSREGRVEICSNEVWGTVCDDFWDDTDALVVCYQLGYGRQGTAFSFSFFGQGTGPILLDNVGCTGSENRLIECSHNGVGQHNCVHFEDAGVQCGGTCTDGSVRLVGGSNEYEGRVELCSSGLWGTVCDDFWGDADASVVCGQLGYTPVGARGIQQAFFGQGTGDILLDDVQCIGTEARLTDCPAITTHNCNHFEDASAVCSPDDPAVCSSLIPPANGFITYSPDITPPFNYLTMATYSCNSGYALSNGDNVTTCNSTGGWSGTPPTCQAVSCTELGSINNGSIAYSPDIVAPFDYGTTATYFCNEGLYLEGDQRRTCQGDDSSPIGTWSGMSPVCAAIMCPALFPPANGYISYTEEFSPSFGFMEMAAYSCNAGFGLSSGNPVRTCSGVSAGSSGDWDGIPPTCEAVTCPALSAISNGQIIFTTDSSSPHNFGTVAAYVCDTGYALLGDDARSTCGGDGSSPGGVWSGTPPNCAAYLCDPLASVANGDISYIPDTTSPYAFGTIALYSCGTGYLRSGSPVQTCLGQGSNTTGFWDSSPPACIAVQCLSLTPPLNALITYSSNPPYEYLTTATYECNSGFGLLGGDKLRACIGSDEWTGVAPSCAAITCSTLNAPANGQVSYSTFTSTYFVGTVASYSCDTGYGLNGGDVMSTCEGDGSNTNGVWDGVVPTCQSITCAELPAPVNGFVAFNMDFPYGFGTVATYSCNIDGALSGGNTVRNCSGDGTNTVGVWSGTASTCQANTCSSLDSVTNGLIMYSPGMTEPFDIGTTATYSCNSGFTLGGVLNRTCTAGGVWSGGDSVCTASGCPNVLPPTNGNIRVTGDTSTLTVTYFCNEGYGLLGGDTVRTCSSTTNTYTGTAPTCQAITCSSLSLPDNGAIVFSPATSEPYQFGTTATYSCNNNFGLSTNEILTCGGDGSSPNGMWVGIVPTCVAITCVSLALIPNGMITYAPDISSPYDFGTNATYSCNDGFFLEGEGVRTCVGDGSNVNGGWNGNVPQCTAIMCPSLFPPPNGVIIYSPDNTFPYAYQTMATYSCILGYGIFGQTTRTCVESALGGGEWSDGADPTCQTVTCPALPTISNGQITYSMDTSAPYEYGTVATYVCDTSYGVSGGEGVLFCGGDGSDTAGSWGTSIPTCESIVCAVLNPLLNGMITYLPTATNPLPFGSAAEYACNDGFYLQGNNVRTCDGDGSSSDGVWSDMIPVCSAILCPTLVPPTNGMISYNMDMTTPFDYQTMATYSCASGYTLIGGDNVRTCVGSSDSRGEWSGMSPICEVTTCPELNVDSGVIAYSATIYLPGTTATYSCSTGFGPNGGDVMRTCGGNGVWSGTPTSCDVITCSALGIANGMVTYNSDPLTFGTIATYSCNNGYFLSGITTRTCSGDSSTVTGSFTGVDPVCSLVTCPALPPAVNGVIAYSTASSAPFIPNTMAIYSCNTGYGRNSDDVMRICGSDGVWSGAPLSCGLITCLAVTIANGFVSYSPDTTSPFNYATTATYTCNDGFFLSVDAARVCIGDGSSVTGSFSGSDPVCTPSTCTSLTPPTNGIISYSPDNTPPFDYQTTATYSCNPGYGLSGGDSVRTCTSSSVGAGEWTETAPICRTPGPPMNLNYQLDDASCRTITITWSPPLQMDQTGTITMYQVVVTQHSTREQITQTTTNDGTNSIVFNNNLECCRDYDFTVAASIGSSNVFGEVQTLSPGFSTRPDLTNLATVTVNVVSDTTLRVSWVEPSSLTHLPSDTYTVTVTPNCKNDQTGPVAPAPQTVAYNAGPVTVNSLEPQVSYIVQVDAIVCAAPVFVYNITQSTTPGVGIGIPIITSSEKRVDDPSRATVTWSGSNNVADIFVYTGEDTITDKNPARVVPVSAGQSTVDIDGLEICTVYQIVARAATCAEEASSDPHTIDLVDVTIFDFIVDLNGASTCNDYIDKDTGETVTNIERSMQEALLSTDCGSFSVSCFASSALECSRDNPTVVYFSSSLVGHGPGRSSTNQAKCLDSWLNKNPQVNLGAVIAGLSPVTPATTDSSFPPWAIAIVVVLLGLFLLIVIIVAAVIFYRFTRSRKFDLMSNSTSINYNPEDDAIGIVQNPLFLETDPPVDSPAAKTKASEALGEEMKEDLAVAVNLPDDI